MGVLVISFDAVGDLAFNAMAEDSAAYPNIARFKKEAFFQGGVETVFVSNTYPAHTTVATGKPPSEHGIISNFLPAKNGERPWAQRASLISKNVKTLWDAAREKKLSVAAIFWPVTCGAKISYNIPEVHSEKGQSRFLQRLLFGSAFFQLQALIKQSPLLLRALLKNRLRGIGQPALDNFAAAVTCNLLKLKSKPDLVLLRLYAYDQLFHFTPPNSKEREAAKKALDTNLGKLLECAEGCTVIIFGDHSMSNIHENVNLRALYGDAVFEQTGGSAFFRFPPAVEDAEKPEHQPWFARYLTKTEMQESGYADKLNNIEAFGIAAKPGYCFSSYSKYTGNHGYPPDYDGCQVFYAVRGGGFLPAQKPPELKPALKGCLTDITTIIACELGLEMEHKCIANLR
jgi:predicted AlkP superfamily pyrophosphatase or phosphodiesterase